jgi:hypothetical protein
VEEEGAMLVALVVQVGVAQAAEGTPVPEGRDLLYMDGTTLDGNGPGGGLFLRGTGLGDADPTAAGTLVVGWTVKPLRLAVELPASTASGGLAADPPRIDGRLVLADRRRGGLGVAGGIDLAVPFVPGRDPNVGGRLSLAVGKQAATLAVDLSIRAGPDIPLDHLGWSVGGAVPILGPLTAFAEVEATSPMHLGEGLPWFEVPALREARAGLHLAPVPPLILTLAVAGPVGPGAPSAVAGAVWIPPARRRRPGTEGPDRDHDHVSDAVDLCPHEKEDFDGGNDADGCPDGGAQADAAAARGG